MKSRLLILSTSFPRTLEDDAGVFVLKLIEALSRQGAEGAVIVPKDINEETLQSVGNFTLKRFRYGIFSSGQLAYGAGIMPNLKQSPALVFQIPAFIITFFFKALRLSGPSTVIQANWIVSGLIAWLVALIKGGPYITTIRGEDMRLLEKPLLKALFAPSLRKAAGVITVSESLRTALLDHGIIQTEQVHVIENGVDSELVPAQELETLRRTRAISADERFLLFIGTVIPRKQIDKIVAIINQPELREYRLRICGRIDDHGEYQRLLSLISDLLLTDRVFFEGSVAPRRIATYLSIASGYITASNFEGRPNAVLEALAYGRVVFASNIAAHREIINDQKNGIILEGSSAQEDAQRIARILSDSQTCNLISLEARASVANLSWERTAKRYLKFIDSSCAP